MKWGTRCKYFEERAVKLWLLLDLVDKLVNPCSNLTDGATVASLAEFALLSLLQKGGKSSFSVAAAVCFLFAPALRGCFAFRASRFILVSGVCCSSAPSALVILLLTHLLPGASRTVATVLSTPGESSVKSFASRCPAPSPLRFGSPPVWRRFRSACQACGLAPPARLSGCRPDAPYSAYSPCCSACSSGEDQVCRRRGGRARTPCTCRCFLLLD